LGALAERAGRVHAVVSSRSEESHTDSVFMHWSLCALSRDREVPHIRSG